MYPTCHKKQLWMHSVRTCGGIVLADDVGQVALSKSVHLLKVKQV